jgi:ribonuclease inhibitor
MKSITLDGVGLPDAAAVYRSLAAAFDFPDYFGNNPDALWDALSEYGGEPVAITWLHSAHSAATLGRQFSAIVAVLQQAAATGQLTLRLA